MKIHYKTETDEKGIVVDYFIEPDPAENWVKWLLYPNLPKDLDVRKGDEMSLDSLHDYDRQAYQDFLKSPRYELSDLIYNQVIVAMDKGKKTDK